MQTSVSRNTVGFLLFIFFALSMVSIGCTALANGHDLGGIAFIGMGFFGLALAGWFMHRRK
jgi:hypothetical protein